VKPPVGERKKGKRGGGGGGGGGEEPARPQEAKGGSMLRVQEVLSGGGEKNKWANSMGAPSGTIAVKEREGGIGKRAE